MKCFFCNAEIRDGKDKCDYCGKYQHDKKTEDDSNKEEEVIEEKASVMDVVIFVGKILLCLAVFGLIIFFVYKNINNDPFFYGKWNCSNRKFVLTIDSDTFKMDYGTTESEKASYFIEQETENDNGKVYVLNVSAIKTVINGDTITNKNNTKFEVKMDEEILMLNNKITGDSYKCYKYSE